MRYSAKVNKMVVQVRVRHPGGEPRAYATKPSSFGFKLREACEGGVEAQARGSSGREAPVFKGFALPSIRRHITGKTVEESATDLGYQERGGHHKGDQPTAAEAGQR